jgi:hypothetical protein
MKNNFSSNGAHKHFSSVPCLDAQIIDGLLITEPEIVTDTWLTSKMGGWLYLKLNLK